MNECDSNSIEFHDTISYIVITIIIFGEHSKRNDTRSATFLHTPVFDLFDRKISIVTDDLDIFYINTQMPNK